MSRPIMHQTVVASDADVFSISDAHLAQRYRFIREIGAGNWGCVWLCSPKTDDSATNTKKTPERVAVKLVFREKKPTTAQRVRSLWNEMKVVRALKDDPHPSIIPFHSFIITPSFAIITMDYLPYLIPVEVPEYKARDWFHSLLSAVEFIHARGIVHNDIKPANILLSTQKVPVLVDFGFAERYDMGSKRAFLSNLAYGTPEYLSPERARGNTHDTRKSDMWSLGITFFEILIGRTPFEYVEGEKFMTPADLERYWARSVKGRWVGKWKMSSSAERFLRGLIAPNADVRCTASEAMKDLYWTDDLEDELTNEDLYTMSSPASMKSPIRTATAERSVLSPRRENAKPATPKRNINTEARTAIHARRRVNQHTLPPIQGSPSTQKTTAYRTPAPLSVQTQSQTVASRVRVPVKRKPVPRFDDENVPPTSLKNAISKVAKDSSRKPQVLADSTSRIRNGASEKAVPVEGQNIKMEEVKAIDKDKRFGSGSYDRVKAFERLKQLERSKFLEEDDFDYDTEQVEEKSQDLEQGALPKSKSPIAYQISTANVSRRTEERSVTEIDFDRRTADSSFTLLSDCRDAVDELLRSESEMPLSGSKVSSGPFARSHTNDSNMTLFKQSFKLSIEKLSTIGRAGTLKNARRASEDLQYQLKTTRPGNWEGRTLVRDVPKSTLPGVQQSLLIEQAATDHELDRLTMWMRNVEEVVKEAKENFASSSVTPLSPLPAPPISRPVIRNGRVARSNRKILAVDQIFQAEHQSSLADSVQSSEAASSSSKHFSSITRLSPGRARRATFSSGPTLSMQDTMPDDLDLSPSKRREKSKSSGNLNSMLGPISPLSVLQKELEKEESGRVPNLNAVLDRSVFVAKTSSTPALDAFHDICSPSTDVFSSSQGPRSSVLVNALRESSSFPILNGSSGRSEGIHERFVLGADSLARIKKGSRQASGSERITSPKPPVTIRKNSKIFSRPGRPLQISSPIPIDTSVNVDDSALSTSMSMSMPFSMSGSFRDDANRSVSAVRKAFKAIVAGKSVARRTSKVM